MGGGHIDNVKVIVYIAFQRESVPLENDLLQCRFAPLVD